MKAQIEAFNNVSYQLFGSDGQLKPLFQENKFALTLIKSGVLSPLWINRWYGLLIAPFLGQWAEVKTVRNKIVNAGLAESANLLGNVSTPTAFSYIAVGTGTTAVAATDTTLETESSTSGLSRAAATVSRITVNVTNDTTQFLKSFSVSGSVAVTESGVFNASSNGTMLCRQTFSAINVVNGDTLQVTWKVTYTSAN